MFSLDTKCTFSRTKLGFRTKFQRNALCGFVSAQSLLRFKTGRSSPVDLGVFIPIGNNVSGIQKTAGCCGWIKHPQRCSSNYLPTTRHFCRIDPCLFSCDGHTSCRNFHRWGLFSGNFQCCWQGSHVWKSGNETNHVDTVLNGSVQCNDGFHRKVQVFGNPGKIHTK